MELYYLHSMPLQNSMMRRSSRGCDYYTDFRARHWCHDGVMTCKSL